MSLRGTVFVPKQSHTCAWRLLRFARNDTSAYRKSTASKVGLSPDVKYGCQLKIGNDGMWYGRKGLRAYPAPWPVLGGRPETLMMNRDVRGLFYNCPEFRLFFRAQNSPHIVGRVVLTRQ